METSFHQSQWQSVARKVARSVNLGWWIESMSAPLMVTSLLLACATLLARREFPHVTPLQTGAVIATALVLLAILCWALAARKFETPASALVRIESEMKMNNALSTAMAGRGPWPPLAAKVHSGLRWQWSRVLVPPLGALIVLIASQLIPLTAVSNSASRTTEKPQAWQKLESQLDQLTEQEVADPKYLEETRQRLDQLKSQEEDQWFSHSSLEATDSLSKSHSAETQRMERDLQRAANALNQLEKTAGTASEAANKQMAETFQKALQGLQNGAMKPNPKLLEQMQGLDPKNLSQLSPEQIQQLKENLKKHQEAMQKSNSSGETDWSDELLADQDSSDEGEGQCEGDGEGEGAGKGGVSRGPGHDPGVLGREKNAIELGTLSGLEAKDLSRSTTGDLLELQTGEHDVDRSQSTLSSGGQSEFSGKGGDRVWRDSLNPAEQKALKQFFE